MSHNVYKLYGNYIFRTKDCIVEFIADQYMIFFLKKTNRQQCLQMLKATRRAQYMWGNHSRPMFSAIQSTKLWEGWWGGGYTQCSKVHIQRAKTHPYILISNWGEREIN